MGRIYATGSPAAEHRPTVDDHLPHGGEERIGVIRVKGQAGTAGVGVDEKDAIPGLAAVFGAIHAAFLLGSGGAADGAGIDDIRILRMHDNASNTPGFIESHVLPCLAGVDGFIDAIAHKVGVADDPGLAGAGPYNFRIGGGNGERADGLHVLFVEDRDEASAAVGGLPYSA